MTTTKYISLTFLFIFQLLPTASANPSVEIETNKGTITVELKQDCAQEQQGCAPKTVENFLHYVDTKYYDNTLFHRIIKDFMIQGGSIDPNLVVTAETTKTTEDAIGLETHKDSLKNVRGTIAMARTSESKSAVAQFYINTVDNNFLNYADIDNPGYAVFGMVTEGMDIVDSISKVTTDGRTDAPINEEKIIITKVRRINAENGELFFTDLKENYAVGDVINLSLEESGDIRKKDLDLWVAVLLPNGKLIYLNRGDSFTEAPTHFKSAVKVGETTHQVLNFTVPEGIAGHYSFYAIFNEPGADISNLDQTSRSEIATIELDLANK